MHKKLINEKSFIMKEINNDKKCTILSKLISTIVVVQFLLVQLIDCKSLPIDQTSMLPSSSSSSSSSKLPMIFLGKSHYQHSQQQQHQFHQHHQHHQIQPQLNQQFNQQRGQMLAAPVAPNSMMMMMNLTEPMAAAKSSSNVIVANPQSRSQQQNSNAPQSSEMIQTSASYMNEVSSKSRHRHHQPEAQAAASAQAEADEGDNEGDEGADGSEPGEGEPAALKSISGPERKSYQQVDENDQVLPEPTRRQVALPSPRMDSTSASGRATVEAMSKLRYNGPANLHPVHLEQPEVDEQAQRKEQESAEASEAELADRSALDEQQQQQREIILAQAQSEAKAIKEQQKLLLEQQALQQQMILRRQDLDAGHHNKTHPSFSSSAGRPSGNRRSKQSSNLKKQRARQQQQQQQQLESKALTFDDDQVVNERRGQFVNKPDEEMADYSIRRPAVVRPASPVVQPMDGSIPRNGVSDLLPAAQHSYGAHYAPLHGHQKDYYQFAESFKQGQFHSGYKRGGAKLQISGHASQHKSHAEGHAKWNGFKGKGVSYWNYQHGDHKKHDYHHDDDHSHSSHGGGGEGGYYH